MRDACASILRLRSHELFHFLARLLVLVHVHQRLHVVVACSVIVWRGLQHGLEKNFRVVREIVLARNVRENTHALHVARVFLQIRPDRVFRLSQVTVSQHGPGSNNRRRQARQLLHMLAGDGRFIQPPHHPVQGLQCSPTGGQGRAELNGALESIDGRFRIAPENMAMPALLMKARKGRVPSFQFSQRRERIRNTRLHALRHRQCIERLAVARLLAHTSRG